MTAELRFANIREKLRSLFLEELLIDEGWSAYINLLLANISYDNLLLLRTNGFPASFNFPKQVFTYGNNGVNGYLYECFTVVAGEDNTIGFRYDGTSSRRLDFATIDVIPVNIEKVTITNPATNVTNTWVAGYGPEFITFDPDFITTFYVSKERVLIPVETPITGLEFAVDNLSGYGGTEIDGRWYYTYDQAVAAVEQVGDGWRLPTAAEFQQLADVGSTWDADLKGRWFGGNHATDHAGSIFLPCWGSRDRLTGELTNVGASGRYWGDYPELETSSNAGNLFFSSSRIVVANSNNRNFGYPVRLVRDIENGEKFVPDPDFDLIPYRLPEELDPAAIDEAIFAEGAYQQPLEPPTSPQALFGLLSRLLRGHNINVWYEFANGIGAQRQSFPDYVKLHSLTTISAGNDQQGYVTAWTDSPVPLDPLRDMFGWGLNLSKIIGYDKQYLVVFNNAPKENIVPLVANDTDDQGTGTIAVSPKSLDFPQRGDTSQVQVSVTPPTDFGVYPLFLPPNQLSEPFVLVANDENGNLIYLADPASIQDNPVVGITKFYSMLSINKGGILKKIHLEGKVISAELESVRPYLQNALDNAAKPGVIGDMAFYFPSVADKVEVTDKYTPQFYIRSSLSEITFSQRGGTAVTQIDVRPHGHAFEVKGGDAIITPIPGLEFAAENLTGHGGTEINGRWYYTYDQAVAAAAEIGDGWRLPTKEEFRQLTEGGVNGTQT